MSDTFNKFKSIERFQLWQRALAIGLVMFATVACAPKTPEQVDADNMRELSSLLKDNGKLSEAENKLASAKSLNSFADLDTAVEAIRNMKTAQEVYKTALEELPNLQLSDETRISFNATLTTRIEEAKETKDELLSKKAGDIVKHPFKYNDIVLAAVEAELNKRTKGKSREFANDTKEKIQTGVEKLSDFVQKARKMTPQEIKAAIGDSTEKLTELLQNEETKEKAKLVLKELQNKVNNDLTTLKNIYSGLKQPQDKAAMKARIKKLEEQQGELAKLDK